MKTQIFDKMAKKISSTFLVFSLCQLAVAAQVKVGIDHDMTKPTYGLQGTSSSQVTYDDRNGLNMRGTINDLLGPPIKIANGFSNMFQGSSMSGLGSNLKTNGAVVGFDSKLLEAAGGASLLKGGLLLGGAAAKTGAATVLKGLPGKKIASIIEMPVKVVALKDIAAGKALMGLGNAKSGEAQESNQRGDEMVRKGDALKQQGMQQVLQGASEGMQNINNIVQQTAGNAASAIRLLPIMLDMHDHNQQQHPVETQQLEATKGQQRLESTPHQLQRPITGGSFFGGLGSLLPTLPADGPYSTTGNDPVIGSPFGGIFGGLGGHNNMYGNNRFAAVLNATNPLTNLLMNPSLNPFLIPINGGGAFNQGTKTSGSGSGLGLGLGSGGGLFSGLANGLTGQFDQNGQSSTVNYNLFPGLRIRETMSSHPPSFDSFQHHSQQQSVQQFPEKTAPVEQQQITQQVVEQAPVKQAPVQQVEQSQSPKAI